jgi:hypothetical protein
MSTKTILSRLIFRMAQDLRGPTHESQYLTEREIVEKRLLAIGLDEDSSSKVFNDILAEVTRRK